MFVAFHRAACKGLSSQLSSQTRFNIRRHIQHDALGGAQGAQAFLEESPNGIVHLCLNRRREMNAISLRLLEVSNQCP